MLLCNYFGFSRKWSSWESLCCCECIAQRTWVTRSQSVQLCWSSLLSSSSPWVFHSEAAESHDRSRPWEARQTTSRSDLNSAASCQERSKSMTSSLYQKVICWTWKQSKNNSLKLEAIKQLWSSPFWGNYSIWHGSIPGAMASSQCSWCLCPLHRWRCDQEVFEQGRCKCEPDITGIEDGWSVGDIKVVIAIAKLKANRLWDCQQTMSLLAKGSCDGLLHAFHRFTCAERQTRQSCAWLNHMCKLHLLWIVASVCAFLEFGCDLHVLCINPAVVFWDAFGEAQGGRGVVVSRPSEEDMKFSRMEESGAPSHPVVNGYWATFMGTYTKNVSIKLATRELEGHRQRTFSETWLKHAIVLQESLLRKPRQTRLLSQSSKIGSWSSVRDLSSKSCRLKGIVRGVGVGSVAQEAPQMSFCRKAHSIAVHSRLELVVSNPTERCVTWVREMWQARTRARH